MGKEIKRMRYFDGLFLNAEDYALDQEHQRRLQQLHNRYLHTWGIVTGLEVSATSTPGTSKVIVSEGMAINQVKAGEVQESVSQEIFLYGTEEERTVDFSKCEDKQNYYVVISYNEYRELPSKDEAIEKGKGNPIYTYEKGHLEILGNKPEDPAKQVILARVRPTVIAHMVNGEETKEVRVDSECIFDTDDNGTSPIRTYAGPAGRVMALEKLILKIGDDTEGMPYIRAVHEEAGKVGLEVSSDETRFIGSVTIKGDLTLDGKLEMTGDGAGQELLITNSFVQVNTPPAGGEWNKSDGGLEVYRKDGSGTQDARIVWVEAEEKWKIGVGNQLFEIGYGNKWDNLIKGNFADDLHKHAQLWSQGGIALQADSSGNLKAGKDMFLNDKTLWLRSDGDKTYGLGWFGIGKPFAGINVDGPVLFGRDGGILGTTLDKEKPVLVWNSLGNVGIGVSNPKDDNLEVAGSLRILSGSNPVRFTASHTGFPNNVNNQAEISNDTTNYKALMIVGNRSSGNERRVAVWDRLDVNGYLSVNGNMQVTQAITPSWGKENNGIIFPSDIGGGGGDSAWIKYYPVSGEACSLVLGTSNDADDHVSLMPSGNVGIGTLTPNDKLDVTGWVRIMSGQNPIRFTSQWTGFPDNATNRAEICNDTTYHKTLMIVGNQSAGQGRKVSVWDRLEVNGTLQVNGSFQTTGVIIPSVGNGQNNGITFPRDPGGGSGDAAWIRYFSDTARGGGENMTLEIGISNDGVPYWSTSGDRINLTASGGVYIDGYFYFSSSRKYKENIENLSTKKAKQVLEGLNPVVFNFKGDTTKKTIGFIAEEVPKEVAAHDQKAISPMEIIAVLTSVVKEQRKAVTELQNQVENLKISKKS